MKAEDALKAEGEREYPYCAFCETPLSEHPEPLCSPDVVRRLRAELAEARRENTNWREITETYNEASENWRKRAMPAEAERDALKAELSAIKDAEPTPCPVDHLCEGEPSCDCWCELHDVPIAECPTYTLVASWIEARDSELAEARAATTSIRDALQTAHRIMACSSRDWSLHADDVWLYALLVGWDCELPEHADGGHDEIDCDGPDGLERFAERFGWTEGGIAKLRTQRRTIATLDAPQRPEDAREETG